MNGIGSCRAAVQHLLLLLLLLLLSGQLAAASQQSGYIPPPSTVPDFDPAVWNQAYQLTLRNVPAEVSSKELLQSLRFPNTMLKGVHLRECSPQGFETTQLADAALGSCFSRQGAQGRRDYRVKLPGLALVAGNCWCYALGMFQGGYCYPGTNSEAAVRYRQKMTCTAVVDAVTADGGVQVSRQQALAGQPRRGHYVALLARPESCIKGHCYEADFHAMRKDSSGSFSWKHPGMPATNRDLFGALVFDPEAAALLGSYQVCGYFRVEPQKMMHADGGSHKEPGPLPVNPALEKFRAMPGVQVEVEPIPYNQSTDCAHSTGSQQVVEEDTAWERLRGSEEYSAWRVREKQALGVLPRGVVNELDAGSSSGRSSDGPKRLLLRGPGVRGGSRQQQ